MAWAGQCQELADNAYGPDTCRGALPFQPELSFRPTRDDELFVNLGFASGNGLNDVPPFWLSPWAADLEDDVKDINGRGRNHLLTAWYRHAFEVGEDTEYGVTIGIIDATEYLNKNVYANDEFSQFMNEALESDPEAFLPAYDWGAALEWNSGRWALQAVAMQVGENRDGNSYDFVGAGLSYGVPTPMGKGNYRIFLSATSDDFLGPSGTGKERLTAVGLSFDQTLSETLGAFLRIARRGGGAAVAYETDIAGGLQIDGQAWGRAVDNIGLGYVYLWGGSRTIEDTHVAEAYYRFAVGDQLSLTADVQYMVDERKDGGNPKGFIFGLRTTADF